MRVRRRKLKLALAGPNVLSLAVSGFWPHALIRLQQGPSAVTWISYPVIAAPLVRGHRPRSSTIDLFVYSRRKHRLIRSFGGEHRVQERCCVHWPLPSRLTARMA